MFKWREFELLNCKEEKMRIIFLLIFCLLFTSCGKSNRDSNQTDEKKELPTEPISTDSPTNTQTTADPASGPTNPDSPTDTQTTADPASGPTNPDSPTDTQTTDTSGSTDSPNTPDSDTVAQEPQKLEEPIIRMSDIQEWISGEEPIPLLSDINLIVPDTLKSAHVRIIKIIYECKNQNEVEEEEKDKLIHVDYWLSELTETERMIFNEEPIYGSTCSVYKSTYTKKKVIEQKYTISSKDKNQCRLDLLKVINTQEKEGYKCSGVRLYASFPELSDSLNLTEPQYKGEKNIDP